MAQLKTEFVSKLKKGREIATRAALEVVQVFEGKVIEGKLQKSLGYQYADTGEQEKAVKNFKELYDIAEERENTEDKERACKNLGRLFFKIGKYEHSIKYFSEYLQIASRSRTDKAWADRVIGLSYCNLGQYKEAIPYLEQCLELEGLRDDEEMEETSGNLGIAYRELGEYDKATKKLKECLRISELKEDKNLEQQMHQELGYVYTAMNQHETAAEYFQHSLRLAKELGDKAKIATAYSYLAKAYLLQSRPQTVIDYLKEARTIVDRVTTAITHADLLGRAYLMKKEPREAIKCFDQYLSMANEENDTSGQAHGAINMGKSYTECGEYELAVEYYREGLKLVEQLEDKNSKGDKKIEGEAHEGLGDIYYKTSQYGHAKNHYENALKISTAQHDVESKGRVDIKLGDVFHVQKSTKEASPYYDEAEQIAKSLGDKAMEADSYEGQGNVFHSTSDYDRAIEKHNKSLELAIQIKDMKRQQRAYENLGNSYFALQKWSEASKSYSSSCAIAKDNKDTTAVYRCERMMGNAYYENKDFDNAILHHRRCLEIAMQTIDKAEKAESYKVMGHSYSKINQPQNALEFYDKFVETVDITMNKLEVATVYHEMGKLCAECGDNEKAIGLYHECLDLQWNLSDFELKQETLERLGDACYKNCQYRDAYTYYFKIDLPNIIEPDRRCQIYYKLGKAVFFLKDIVKAIQFYYEALSLAQDVEIKADIHEALGDAFYSNADYENAIMYHSQGLEYANKILNDEKRRQREYGKLGDAYSATKQWLLAIENYCHSCDIVENIGDKTVMGECERKMGIAYYHVKKFNKAIEILEKANEKSQLEQIYYNIIGCAYAKIGQYKKSIEFLSKGLRIATDVVENTEISTRVKVLGKLGCIWRSMGQHEMAIGCHQNQAQTAEDLKDLGHLARAFENLGIDHELNGDYVQALEQQEKYLEVSKKMDDDVQQGRAHINIAKVYLAKGEYERAIRKSEITERLGNKGVNARAYSVIGCAYTALGEYQMAEGFHRKEMGIMCEFDDKLGIAQASGNMGMAHIGTGDYSKVAVCFRQQMKLAKEIKDKREECRANENLGNYYAAIGECTEAISYYNKSLQLAGERYHNDGRVKGCMGNAFTEIGQYRNAVKCHEEEIKIAKNLGNKVREGEALGNLGNAYTGLCEYQKAIELHEESLKIAEDYVVQADERRANGNLGNAYVASGQYRKALDFQRRALEISQQLSHRAAEGRIHESMARAYYLSGHIEKAVESSRKSLRIASEVGDKAGKGRALGTLGNAYMEFGQNKQTAISSLREYLRISKELSNEADKGDALGSMAAVLIEIGQYNKAFESCNESLKIAKQLKDEAREGRAYENLGKFYTAIGQYEEAIKTHGKHLNIATKLGDRAEMGRANGNLGNVYNKNDKHENAMECHTIDKDIAEELGNVARVGRAQGNMGNTYSKLRQFEKAFDCHRKRLSIAEELNDKTSLAEALLGLGEHYINTGQFEKAIQFLYRLHEISTHNYELTAIAQELLGQCYQKHDVPKACRFFAKSIINFQILRNPLRHHDDFNISMSNRFAHIHMLLVQSLLDLKEVKTALLVSDRGKAQALYDLMRKIVHSGMDLCFNYSDPMETLAQDPSSDTSKILFDNSLFNVINSNHADTIISYAFGEKGELHSWVISKKGVFHKPLNIANKPSMRNYVHGQIDRFFKYNINVTDTQEGTLQDVKAVYDFETRACNPLCLMSEDFDSDQKTDRRSPPDEHNPNSTPQKLAPSTESSPAQTDDSSLQNLYTILIKPIEEHLTGSKLLIVPEGPLFTLPFAALLDPNEHHVCDKYSLQFAPSLHVLNSCLSTLPPKLGPALFVGNPDLNGINTELESIPFAEEEVADCSKHFSAQPLVRHMATKQNVLNLMGGASIIHIAAHGDMNRAEIYLTPNQGEPLIPSSYLLTAEDILKCSLNARLVVLSCCCSGRGQISAEGVVGTARSFLGSGARAVLVTLWGINDETTKEFMITFYEKLIQEYSVCTAVQQAMMALKGRRYPSRYWAPFQVFGEDIVLTREDIEEIRLMSA